MVASKTAQSSAMSGLTYVEEREGAGEQETADTSGGGETSFESFSSSDNSFSRHDETDSYARHKKNICVGGPDEKVASFLLS